MHPLFSKLNSYLGSLYRFIEMMKKKESHKVKDLLIWKFFSEL